MERIQTVCGVTGSPQNNLNVEKWALAQKFSTTRLEGTARGST